MQTLGEKAEIALRIVREAPVIAYDSETSGLDWRIHSVVGYVITCPEQSLYIPIRMGGGANLMDPNVSPLREANEKTVQHRWEKELADAFYTRIRRGFLTIGHNLKFDMHMSANHGVSLGRNCEDTQHNAAMLDEFARSFSLDGCAAIAGVTAKKGQPLYDRLAQQFGCKADKSAMGEFWRLSGDDPVGVEYAEGDGITTLELRAWQHPQIIDQGMQEIHRIESELIWSVFRMERRGIAANADRIKSVQEEIEKRLNTARANLPKHFNERSGPQIKKLFEAANISDWPMTEPSRTHPQGQPSFTEKWLKKHAIGRYIVDVRKLTNLNNSFITPLKEHHIFNGRVHASLNQLKSDEYGTISGRFSSSQPNMQQVPKRDKELGRLFRSIFVADEGMEMEEGDYSQCEPCLFAHFSKDESLVHGYSSSPRIDVHDIVAQNFKCERDPTAKRMNMGIFTGMQPKTLAGHMGWDVTTATEQFNAWFALFPGVRAFQDQAKAVFKSRGYVRTILGRRMRLDHPRFAYRATSRIIQGNNADIVKDRFLCADKYLESEGDKAYLQMTVHDSFLWQSPKGETGLNISKELVRIFLDVQSPPFSLRVPFVMDSHRGPNWAIATYGPPKTDG